MMLFCLSLATLYWFRCNDYLEDGRGNPNGRLGVALDLKARLLC